jgi:hypothetical protein
VEQSLENQAAHLLAQCQGASEYMQTQAFRDLESHEQASLQQRVQGCMQRVQYLRHVQQQRQQLEQQQQSSSPGTGMGEPLLQTTQAQPPPGRVLWWT